MYSMLERTDPLIAPLRHALAIWGLTADDIGVFHIHETRTGANVILVLLCFDHDADTDFRRKIRRI